MLGQRQREHAPLTQEVGQQVALLVGHRDHGVGRVVGVELLDGLPTEAGRQVGTLAERATRVAQEVVRNRTVLTPEAKAGLFRWIVPAGQAGAGQTQSFDIVRNDPRALGIDKLVAANLALLPNPNNFDVGDRLKVKLVSTDPPRGFLDFVRER